MTRSQTYLSHAAVAIVISSGLAAAFAPVRAQPSSAIAQRSVAELEVAFWQCDRLATESMVDPATAAYCSEATEALRAAKFGGDFSALLGWWQQRKGADRREVAATASGAAALEARVRSLPVDRLRSLYLRCARVSEQRRLDGDEVMACSIASDALLTQVFGGDADALLAWSNQALGSRQDRLGGVASPDRTAEPPVAGLGPARAP